MVGAASRVCFRQALRRTRQSDQQKAGGPFEVDADEEGMYLVVGTVTSPLANDLIRNHDEGGHCRGTHPIVAEAWHLADRI